MEGVRSRMGAGASGSDGDGAAVGSVWAARFWRGDRERGRERAETGKGGGYVSIVGLVALPHLVHPRANKRLTRRWCTREISQVPSAGHWNSRRSHRAI